MSGHQNRMGSPGMPAVIGSTNQKFRIPSRVPYIRVTRYGASGVLYLRCDFYYP